MTQVKLYLKQTIHFCFAKKQYMKWLYLLSGLLFETAGIVFLKYSKGLSILAPTIITVVCDLAALVFFILALKNFESSFVYMIAAGMGTALIVISNYVVFKQHLDWIQVFSIVLIIIGTVSLQKPRGHTLIK